MNDIQIKLKSVIRTVLDNYRYEIKSVQTTKQNCSKCETIEYLATEQIQCLQNKDQ